MDRDSLRLVSRAIDENDVTALQEFSRSATLPDYYNPKSKGAWLVQAVQSGHCAVVKTLLDCGLDPSPECALSPLNWAISAQGDEIVELLLSRGADPNQDRCSIAAVGPRIPVELQLRYLRLLVEHGLDVNRQFDHFGNQDVLFTVLDRAMKPEVQEYLRSVGGLTAAELAGRTAIATNAESSDSSQERKLNEVVAWFEAKFGKVTQSFTSTLDMTSPYSVHMISPSTAGQPMTLFTTGLSQTAMSVLDGSEDALAELYIQLPTNWDLSDSEQRWPVDLLFDLVSYPHANGDVYLSPLTCIANGEPAKAIAANLPFSSTALICIQRFQRSDGKNVQLFFVLPIYAEEHNMIRTDGVPKFLSSLDKHRIDQVFQPNRPNVAGGG